MLYLGVPFDYTLPLSSIVYVLITTLAVTLVTLGTGKLLSARWNIRKIFLLALGCYAIPMIVLSTMAKYMPFYEIIIYASPLAIWIGAEIIVFKTGEIKKSVLMALAGYAIFILFSLIKLNLLLVMFIRG
jgi:hypothetical protein